MDSSPVSTRLGIEKNASLGHTVMQKLQDTQPNISRSFSTSRGIF